MSSQKLYMKCIDVCNNTFFESFIEHIDAGKYSTCINLTPGLPESNIFRTIDTIRSINVITGLVTIWYKSGNRIEITRQ
jgi:hypothetical protein